MLPPHSTGISNYLAFHDSGQRLDQSGAMAESSTFDVSSDTIGPNSNRIWTVYTSLGAVHASPVFPNPDTCIGFEPVSTSWYTAFLPCLNSPHLHTSEAVGQLAMPSFSQGVSIVEPDDTYAWISNFPAFSFDHTSFSCPYIFAFSHHMPAAVSSALEEFRHGLDGLQPHVDVVDLATRIAQVAVESTVHPDITFDVDGELSFYLRLHDGRLLLAELAVDGSIDASLYDDKNSLLKRMAPATEDDFITVLK